MAQPVTKVNYKEINNHKQGRMGSKVPQKIGPAVGKSSGNPTKKGGVMQPTKGKY